MIRNTDHKILSTAAIAGNISTSVAPIKATEPISTPVLICSLIELNQTNPPAPPILGHPRPKNMPYHRRGMV